MTTATMTPPPGAQGRDGLTIVEIVLALGVLSIFLTGIFAAMLHAQRADVLTRERAAASEACFRELDRVMGNPSFALIADVTDSFEVRYDTGRSAAGEPLSVPLEPADPYPAELASRPNPAHAGTVVTVQDPDGDGSADVLEVRVTVAWRAVDGSNQRIDAVARRLQ